MLHSPLSRQQIVTISIIFSLVLAVSAYIFYGIQKARQTDLTATVPPTSHSTKSNSDILKEISEVTAENPVTAEQRATVLEKISVTNSATPLTAEETRMTLETISKL